MLSFSLVAEALTGLIYLRPLGENFLFGNGPIREAVIIRKKNTLRKTALRGLRASEQACYEHSIYWGGGGWGGRSFPKKVFPKKKIFQILILSDKAIEESVKATYVQKCDFSQS